MKFPPARLQSDNGTEAGLVPQELPHDIYAHWLGLRDKRKAWLWGNCTQTAHVLYPPLSSPFSKDIDMNHSNLRRLSLFCFHDLKLKLWILRTTQWQQNREHIKANHTLFTCSPTLILLVSAPSGKTAWTCGTTVLLRMPPSGPIRLLSCLMRDTTAKYCGKSLVMIRQMRFLSSSSGVSSSAEGETEKTWSGLYRLTPRCRQPVSETDPRPCRWVSGWAPLECVHSDAPSSSLLFRSSESPARAPSLGGQRSEGSPQWQDWRNKIRWVSPSKTKRVVWWNITG